MEAPSAHGHRGRVPCMGLLLAVFLYIFWTPLSSGRPTVNPKPIKIMNSGDLVIHAGNFSKNADRCIWYKGDIMNANNLLAVYVISKRELIPGPAFSSNQRIFRDGSLCIKNVTKKDIGHYTVIGKKEENETKKKSIHLFALGNMNVSAGKETTYKLHLNESIIIGCVTNEVGFKVQWLYNDRKLHLNDRMRLSRKQNFLTIKRIKRSDDGQYHCKLIKSLRSIRRERLRLQVV